MKKIDRALLLAVNTKNYEMTEQSINELAELARAVNIKVVDKIIQSLDKINAKYYLGSGKIDEIKQTLNVIDVDMVICDDTLSPSQIRNLESLLDVQVIDRSFLILQIFAERASSKQSILEVSLAQKLYMLPRLAGLGKVLSRQGGGSFNAKGPGETKLELDRRKLSQEITLIKTQLKEIKQHRDVSVQKRIKNAIPVVALVGYTNAGKSSLMNYFTTHWGTDKTLVFEEDLLFATLDTKAKRIKRDNYPPFILIDTVGFISKLPAELIASFESTLNDIKTADLIIHVVDGINPNEGQINFVKQILSQLNLLNIPRITVVTKSDLTPIVLIPIKEDFIQVSSKTGNNMNQLYQLIGAEIYQDARIFDLVIPYSKGGFYHQLKEETTIINTTYLENGIHVRALLTKHLLNKYQKLIIKEAL